MCPWSHTLPSLAYLHQRHRGKANLPKFLVVVPRNVLLDKRYLMRARVSKTDFAGVQVQDTLAMGPDELFGHSICERLCDDGLRLVTYDNGKPKYHIRWCTVLTILRANWTICQGGYALVRQCSFPTVLSSAQC